MSNACMAGFYIIGRDTRAGLREYGNTGVDRGLNIRSNEPPVGHGAPQSFDP